MGWRAKENNHLKVILHVNAAVLTLKERQNTTVNTPHAELQQGHDHGVRNTVASAEN